MMSQEDGVVTSTGRYQSVLMAWSPVLVLMALIVSFSSLEGGRWAVPMTFEHQDKVLHLLVYGGLGGLLMRALWLSDERLEHPSTLIVVLCFVSGFGGFDEFYQGGIPYRTPDLWDWLVDCVGGVVGGSLVLGVLWIRRKASIDRGQSRSSP